ncbi:putative cation-transporting ATPase [Spraguea lophii 42_110]|uniref:Putative cation-transporting ATPase n=1 Tax=Spraguea lophii (strain 42_110) TaxID=1358809 RepID=S7W8Y2_SPRLO|nr:putative cation-transporting ATPase [Spraguea lophii 42_110]
MYFKSRSILYCYYLLPVAYIPLIVALTKSYQIVPFFLTLLSIFLFLSTFWFVKMRILLTMKESSLEECDYILYENSLCKIHSIKNNSEILRYFEHNKIKYRINAEIKNIDPFTARSYGYYKNPTSPYFSEEDKICYGPNIFDIKPPTFFTLFLEHAVAPFFVFQIFCGILWCLDEYIYHALFSLVMMVLFEMGVVFQRIVTMKEFKTMNLKVYDVVRIVDGKEEKIKTSELYPGDIILVNNKMQVPCDLLILSGGCAANEAMLSGESVPNIKEGIEDVDENLIFSMNDKKRILYGGTEIVKIEKNMKCFVLNTGFGTMQGKLIAKMMCSSDKVDANDKESFLFILFLLCFALIAAGYSIREGLRMGKSSYKILLEAILIITSVVPPELPLELTIAVNAALQKLMGLGTFCLEPFRIPYAGKLDTCFFDKTGTLTESMLDVKEIIDSGKEGDIHGSDIYGVVGSCHSLIKLDNGFIEGDPMEKSAFSYLNMNLIDDYTSTINDITFRIEKRFLFSSELRRMTVVYMKKYTGTSKKKQSKTYHVGMKGAPEKIAEFLENIPKNYDETYKDYASKGFRVLAVAGKQIGLEYKTCSKTQIEQKLKFKGFILYESKLKDGSEECIEHLLESNHKVVMITGDNKLTAIEVAKNLNFYNGYAAESTDIDQLLKKDLSKEEFISLASKINKDFNAEEKTLNDLFQEIRVFARSNPDHKEKIIQKYNDLGKYTLMCGDGTNDVGALKKAHVGVALVDRPTKITKTVQYGEEQTIKMGDASIAAPFTAKTGSLSSVLDIIRQGRSTLVTTVQMYKILALNSLISAYSLSVIDSLGVRFGDYQMTVTGILLSLAFMFLTKCDPLKQISKERPPLNIFNRYLLSSTILQTAVHVFTCYKVTKYALTLQDPIIFGPNVELKFSPSNINSILFIFSTYQQLSTFLVNYIGRPFRESLFENYKLFLLLLSIIGFIIAVLFEYSIDFNKSLEIVEFTLESKKIVLFYILLDLLLCWIIEKIIFSIFVVKKERKEKVKKE